MPFQSEKQRRFLHANHPEIAKRWEKEYSHGGISNHFRKKFDQGSDETGVKLSPILSMVNTSETPVEGIDVDVSNIDYGIAGMFQGDTAYAGGEYTKGKVKVNVQQDGNTVFEDSMSKDDLMQLYVGLGEKSGNHVEVGTDGQGNYTLNIIKSFADGGILDINESEEIISDDGNDIELTDYNAAFDDPNDLSTGVKTLFQAKDGGTPRRSYFTGAYGVGGTENTGSQYHGGGADVMAVQPVAHPTGDASEAERIAAADRKRKAEADLAFSRSPGSDEEKYDTEEQMIEQKWLSANLDLDDPTKNTWRAKEGEKRRRTYIDNKKQEAYQKTLSVQKASLKKMGMGRLIKGLALLLVGVPPKNIMRSLMLTKDDMEKLLKESLPVIKAKMDLTNSLKETIDIYTKLGMTEFHHAVDTDLQKINQQLLDLTQTKDKDEERDNKGIELPQVVPIGEEIEAYEDTYAMSAWDRIKANQAKRAMLVEKGIIQDSPIVGETVTDITMQANSGGLANLFRVKNQ